MILGIQRSHMEIDDLFSISANLGRTVSTRWKRYMADRVNWSLPMVSLKGARGVGKTTLLLQEMKERYEGNEALYVSLDNIWFSEHRLFDLVNYHYNHGGTCLFADEVHRYPYPNWSQELKNINDSFPNYKVAFTGSSLLEIDLSKADLSRRCIFYTMQGLSFREWLNMQGIGNFTTYSLEDILEHHQEAEEEILKQVRPLKYFSNYLQHGYYPFYQKYAESYGETLRQVMNVIVESDLPATMSVGRQTVMKFKRLLFIISKMVPFTPNIAKLCQSVETNRSQMYQMIDTLNRARLIKCLYSGKDNMRQLTKPEKIYLENPNLLYALSKEVPIGNARETFFANQLGEGHSLTFSGDGDFLIDGRYTIEVGGKDKTYNQIKDLPNSFLAIDDVETGMRNKIPLWLFGFLY